MSMTGTTPAPPAGRTAPTRRNPWPVVGLVLAVVVLAVAIWFTVAVWHPWTPAQAPSNGSTITATVPAQAPKGSDLPRGTKLEGGKIVSANGGTITAVIGHEVEKDGLVMSVLQGGSELVATLKPAKGGKLAVDATAVTLNGTFTSTLWNVGKPEVQPDVLEVKIPLGKGVQSITLYWGRP